MTALGWTRPGRPIKGGPRVKATREMWEAADRARIMENHPADCEVCNGARDPAAVLELHRRHLVAINEAFREREAARIAAAARYYEGGHRMVIGGVPIRVAAYVKSWAPWMKKAIGRGPFKDEAREIEEQMAVLWPAFVPSWNRGLASCIVHREPRRGQQDGTGWECWQCRQEESEARQKAWEAERSAARDVAA